MRNRVCWCLITVFFAAAGAARADVVRSGDDQRRAMAVTLYGNGVALVDDQRTVNLAKGNNELRFSSVASAVLPETLQLVTSGELKVVEQEFQPANLTHEQLLKAHVGRTVKLIKTHPTTGEEVAFDAEVLRGPPHLMVRIDGQIETAPPGRLVFTSVPDGFRAEPQFRVFATAPEPALAAIHLRYMTRGLSWRADHVASFDAPNKRLKVETWATLVNQSGLDLKASHMQLMAGAVRQVTQPRARLEGAPMMRSQTTAMADATGTGARQSLGGFHLYTLARSVDLANGESKQVDLLPARFLPATRRLISSGQPNVYGRNRADQTSHPDIEINFENSKKGDASDPIPSGILRLYGTDRQNRAQFLGEDQLPNLPVGETAKLTTGQAFDVTVRRRQIDFKREPLGRNSFEAAFEVRLLNGSGRTEIVEVSEAMSGDWQLVGETPVFRRHGNRAVWLATLAAGEEINATYRVRVRQ